MMLALQNINFRWVLILLLVCGAFNCNSAEAEDLDGTLTQINGPSVRILLADGKLPPQGAPVLLFQPDYFGRPGDPATGTIEQITGDVVSVKLNDGVVEKGPIIVRALTAKKIDVKTTDSAVGTVVGSLDPNFTLDENKNKIVPDKGSETSKQASQPDMSINNPEIQAFVREWLMVAEPPQNAQSGYALRYSQWVQLYGTTPTGSIRINAKPDDVAGQTPEQYAWGKRDKLDSLNNCTLGEYVLLRLRGEPTNICQGRHQNNQGRSEKDEVVLPSNIVGKSYTEAVAAIEAAGLVALPPKLGSNASDPTLVGRVELATPIVNGQLHRGDKIGLRVFGKAVVGLSVPNTVGLGIRAAAQAVESVGLVAEFELGGNTLDPKKDKTIVSQFPDPGVEIEPGKSVKMVVLTLKENILSVPDLKGMPISKAKQVLQNLGLTMAPALGDQEPKSNAEVGQVYRQSPDPGLSVKEGVAINVWVYGELQVSASAPTPQKTTGGNGKTTWIPDYTTGACPSPGEGIVLLKSFFIGGKALCEYGEGCDAKQLNCFSKPILVAWYDREIKEYKNRIEDDQFVAKDSSKGEWVIFSETKRAYVNFSQGGYKMGDTRKSKDFWLKPAWGLLRQVEPHAAPRNFGQSSHGQTAGWDSVGSLHICKDPTIEPDSYALKYARGYGGGETTFFIKQNHFCHKQGYSKIVGNKVDYYECRDSDFRDCSLKTSTSAERKELGDGAYQLIFDDGKSWWTIRPKK